MKTPEFIYPLHIDRMNGVPVPEIRQKGCVIWMYGLSGAGKSTLALALRKQLTRQNIFSTIIDGDDLRAGLNSDLAFSEADRKENIRRAAEVAKILVKNDLVVICSLITPMNSYRQLAGEVIGASFIEVFVDCPLEICEQRDVKGLYKKARSGMIRNFTGLDAPFERPEGEHILLNSGSDGIEQCLDQLYAKLLPVITG